MPETEELIERLKQTTTLGEWEIKSAGRLYWFYDVSPDPDEPSDFFWETYLTIQEEIAPIIGTNWQIQDFWSDNDSCGFYLDKL